MIGNSNENGKENGHQTIFKEKRYSPQAEMILTLVVYLKKQRWFYKNHLQDTEYQGLHNIDYTTKL